MPPSWPTLAADPAVESISPVIDYELDLAETVPYIGATALHERPGRHRRGRHGRRPRQRHRLHPRRLRRPRHRPRLRRRLRCRHERRGEQGRCPTGTLIDEHTNIVGGFDFVGEAWPVRRAVAPDPDPIDCGGKDVNPDIAGRAPLRRRPRHARRRHHRRHRRASPPASSSTPSRSARRSPPPAAASRCCWAWTTPSTRTATASPMTTSTSSTCRSAPTTARRSTTTCRQAVENATDLGVLTVAVGRQRLGQAVRHRHAGGGAERAVGRPDRGAVRRRCRCSRSSSPAGRRPVRGRPPAVVGSRSPMRTS